MRTSGFDSAAGSLERAVSAVLDPLPRTRWRGVAVTVVLGPAWSQFKRLDGIAAAARTSDVRRALETGAARFFVHGGTRFVAAGVESRSQEWWGSALDADLIRRVSVGVARARMTLRGFVPASAFAIGNFEGAHGTAGEAHALAAIALSSAHPLLFDPLAVSREVRSQRLRRTTLAVAAAATATFALFAPGVRATLARRDAARRLTSISAPGLEASADSLRQMRAALAASQTLLGPSIPIGPTIAELTSRLPAESAIVSLRIDARALDLVVLAPVAIEAVAAFDGLRGFQEARVVGAVTRETIDSRTVQRVALHLARAKAMRVVALSAASDR